MPTPEMQAVKSALFNRVRRLRDAAFCLAVTGEWEQSTSRLLVLLNANKQSVRRKMIRQLAAKHDIPVECLFLPECFQTGRRLADKSIRLDTSENTTLEELAPALLDLMRRFELTRIELRLQNAAPELPQLKLVLNQTHRIGLDTMLRHLRSEVEWAVAKLPERQQAAFPEHLSTLSRGNESLGRALSALDAQSPVPSNLRLIKEGRRLQFSCGDVQLTVPLEQKTAPVQEKQIEGQSLDLAGASEGGQPTVQKNFVAKKPAGLNQQKEHSASMLSVIERLKAQMETSGWLFSDYQIDLLGAARRLFSDGEYEESEVFAMTLLMCLPVRKKVR